MNEQISASFWAPGNFKGKEIDMKVPLMTKLTGVSYGTRQENIKQFGCRDIGSYALIREPKNPYDPNAILVSIGRWEMGYIPKEIARQLAPLIDSGRAFLAEFVCVNEYPPYETVGLTVRIIETTPAAAA